MITVYFSFLTALVSDILLLFMFLYIIPFSDFFSGLYYTDHRLSFFSRFCLYYLLVSDIYNIFIVWGCLSFVEGDPGFYKSRYVLFIHPPGR